MIGIIGITVFLRSSGLATTPEDSEFFLSIKSRNLEMENFKYQPWNLELTSIISIHQLISQAIKYVVIL